MHDNILFIKYLYWDLTKINSKILLFSLIFTECPSVSLPSLPDKLNCFIEHSCLAIKCCAALDFRVTEFMVEASIELDPCQYKLMITFGSWKQDIELLESIWGNMKTISIGEFVTIT